MPNTIRFSRTLIPRASIARALIAAATGAVVLAGCSSMQATPMMPTYPAQIGGRGGVSVEGDSICRQQAYQAAEKAKQDNVNKEIAFTAIGTIAGAVIGNQVSVPSGGPRGPRGPGGPGGPGGHRGPGGPGGPGGRPGSHDLAEAGALAGAATGAAMSQSTLQDTQQTFDIYYNNCIERYRSNGY
ncbi:hypothetical protein [Thiocystis violacea]|uniref:hypothetical protein n=1 Tax=Thiocystis violacea TaxID=13725 RepID=UPI0019061F58|nr:hypothetical protein [Thiocystis violacea]MBK1718845.1 hypothetical protein [Thiocystis violacea]